uniref:Uncharacterized protein n=1 Tax=Oryza glumipatula TaxID=40148 RepID=A0A0D9Z2H7_9ORYZ
MQMQMIACCYCARPAHARHGPSAQSSPHRLPICNQSRTAGFLFGAIKDEAAIWKEAGEVAAVATSFHFDSLLSKLTRSVLYPYNQGGQLQQAEEVGESFQNQALKLLEQTARSSTPHEQCY